MKKWNFRCFLDKSFLDNKMELLQVVKLGKVKNPTDIRVNRLLLLKLAIAYLSKMQK